MERGKRRESSAEVSRHRHLMNAQRGNPVWRLTRHQGFDERSARIPGNPGCGKSGKIQILRRNGSSGRQMTKIQLILRNM